MARFETDTIEHYDPRVVQVDGDNYIRNIDSEVATLLGASTPA